MLLKVLNALEKIAIISFIVIMLISIVISFGWMKTFTLSFYSKILDKLTLPCYNKV